MGNKGRVGECRERGETNRNQPAHKHKQTKTSACLVEAKGGDDDVSVLGGIDGVGKEGGVATGNVGAPRRPRDVRVGDVDRGAGDASGRRGLAGIGGLEVAVALPVGPEVARRIPRAVVAACASAVGRRRGDGAWSGETGEWQRAISEAMAWLGDPTMKNMHNRARGSHIIRTDANVARRNASVARLQVVHVLLNVGADDGLGGALVRRRHA